MEGQMVVASKPKVTVANVLPVVVSRLAIVAQFIDVSRPTVYPTMALVTVAATGSVANTTIVIIINQQKQYIRKFFYEKISQIDKKNTDKLTEMLLKLDIKELTVSEKLMIISMATQSPSNSVDITKKNVSQLADDIKSPYNDIQVAALKQLLEIALNEPKIIEQFYENGIISSLNQQIIIGNEAQVQGLSSAIMSVIGLQSEVTNETLRTRTVTEPLIQFIHSSNEKQSKAGSKALCDLIGDNETVRETLLKTGFVELVLHIITSGQQDKDKSSYQSSSSSLQPPSSSSSSSSSSQEIQLNQVSIYSQLGFLDVTLQLSMTADDIQPIAVLIPVLEQIQQNIKSELLQKAQQILDQLKIRGISSQPTIQQLQEDLRREREWNTKLKYEIQHQQEEKEQISEQHQKVKEELEKKNNLLVKLLEENQKLKLKISKDPFLDFSISIDFPVALINKDPDDFELVDIGRQMKKIIKKKQNQNTVSLTQVLDIGIWSIEVEFENIGVYAAVGIVQDSYDIPSNAHPWLEPNNQHMIVFTSEKYFGSVWCKGKEINGNKQFKDNQIVRLEMDCEEGTLTLFLDDVQQPLFISGIKEKVRFIV
ncbi:MAG: hypothetical protein EZS28_008709 [Streblomastix strix]|uniref:B30.2/SPRY domain-containing protein n=1 Tax=Streblomastix strix TaxID=222440 RepID=A0A5J4WLR2_9EUKA|nr:MAG: hypothetical protein EZS28_008709 [Streblomastix strix]